MLFLNFSCFPVQRCLSRRDDNDKLLFETKLSQTQFCAQRKGFGRRNWMSLFPNDDTHLFCDEGPIPLNELCLKDFKGDRKCTAKNGETFNM